METVIRTKVKDLLTSEPGKEVLAKGWVGQREETRTWRS